MVISRPARDPFTSAPQPGTQPPSPIMMLGPTTSSGTTAELGRFDRWDFPLQSMYAPAAISTSTIARTSLNLTDARKGTFFGCSMPANEGIGSSLGAGADEGGAGSACSVFFAAGSGFFPSAARAAGLLSVPEVALAEAGSCGSAGVLGATGFACSCGGVFAVWAGLT